MRRVDKDKLFMQELREKIFSPSGNPPHAILVSNPPVGKLKITNIYYDQITDKIMIDYDDQPIGG